MVMDTIQAVKKAEAEAAQKVKDASEKGRALVEEARGKAGTMRSEAAAAVKQKSAEAQENLAREGDDYLAKSMEEAKGEIASMKEAAEKKKDAAVEMIISELV